MSRPVVPVPIGFRMVLDRDAERLDECTLYGRAPARVLRLSPTGGRALDELLTGPVQTGSGGSLARRLGDAGVMHPRPPSMQKHSDATVLIPVRDRSPELARCLAALGTDYPVIVVDDASVQPELVAAVCATHGATLVRRSVNGGPAAARNTGLAHATSPIIVFLDSDCVLSPGTIDALAAHLDDPLVAAAAPRIAALTSRTAAGRYATACSSLDLGEREARVGPLTRVAYVPTAALVARRTALVDVARAAAVFDPELRYGEDVDLIWRLNAAGWRIRYDPSVTVQHDEPDSWPQLVARRFRYGTSAGPLARRHPRSMAPIVVHPWSALTVGALLARRPDIAAAAFAVAVSTRARTMRSAGLGSDAIRGSAVAAHQTWLRLGTISTQFAAPLLLAAIVGPGRATRRRRWGRRTAAASLLLAPPLTTWATRRPTLDPIRFVAISLADDIAYGAGVSVGSVRARTTIPFRPIMSGNRVSRKGAGGAGSPERIS